VVVTLRHKVTVPVRYGQVRFSPPRLNPCLLGTLDDGYARLCATSLCLHFSITMQTRGEQVLPEHGRRI
jgi:hypothetical protein